MHLKIEDEYDKEKQTAIDSAELERQLGKELVANIPHFTLDQEYYPSGSEKIRIPYVQPIRKGMLVGIGNGLRETAQGVMYPLHVMNGISDEAMEAASPDYIRDDGKVFGDVVENLFWSNQAAHKSQQNEFAKEMEALGGMEKAVGLRAYALGNTLPKKAAEALDPTLGFFQGFAQEFGKDYLGKSEKGVDESEAAWESLKSAALKTAWDALQENTIKYFLDQKNFLTPDKMKEYWHQYPDELNDIRRMSGTEIQETLKADRPFQFFSNATATPSLNTAYQISKNSADALYGLISPEEIYSKRINSQMPLSPLIDNRMKDSAYSSYHPYLS